MSKDYYIKNKEEIIKKQKIYLATHPEVHIKANKNYLLKNKEKLKLKSSEYRENNPEARKTTQAKYRENNKEKISLSRKLFRSLFPDKVKEQYLRNLDNIKMSAKNQKYKRRRAEGKISLADWNSILDRYGHKCLWCGREDVKLTIDHVIPLSCGGTNTIDNVQPLCPSCNSSKHTKTMDFRADLIAPKL